MMNSNSAQNLVFIPELTSGLGVTNLQTSDDPLAFISTIRDTLIVNDVSWLCDVEEIE